MYDKFFPYGELEPKGWIKEQLKIQASGLAGNLDKVWPDIRESRWIGGKRDGWERFPYFLDGFVPLAYLLDDSKLKERADRYIEKIRKSQRENGRICPEDDTDEKNSDIWSIFLVLKVLVEYAEFTGKEGETEEIICRALKYLSDYICRRTLPNWAAARWYECFIPIIWLYERRPEMWLLDLAKRMQLQGIDYSAAGPLWKDGGEYWCYEKHVVNVAMSLKSGALVSRLFGTSYSGEAEKMLAALDEQCGTAYGHFNGDECLARNDSPVRGSELCGIVEAMYSYELLLAETENAAWGDRLEALAFNGLPAAISGDMWTHQYDQQVNQIACVPFEGKGVFATNGKESNLFGLEPHYGCCTANFGQGWPKFFRSAYMRTDGGIAINSPLPAKLQTIVNGHEVCLDCQSDYPFRNTFTIIYNGDCNLSLRIPAWAEPAFDVPAFIEDGWAKFALHGKGQIRVEWKTKPVLETRAHGSCLKYGALLFALPLSYKQEMREYVRDGVERKYPYCDYIFTPTENWAYAFDEMSAFSVSYHNVFHPYDKKNPPITISCNFVPVKWGFKEGCKDVADDNLQTIEKTGEPVKKELWPYGATYLRMTEMPVYPGKQ